MAVYITSDNLVNSGQGLSGYAWTLLTNSLNATITVKFDGAGSGTSTLFGDWYDYIEITQKENTTRYKTTSKTITLTPSDFGYLDSDTDSSPFYTFALGQENYIGADAKLKLGDVYLNGTKIDTVTTLLTTPYSIKITPNPDIFKPSITSFSDISIQSVDWNGLAVAGETILKIDNVTFGNATSDDPNNYYKVYTSAYGTSSSDRTLTRVSNTSIKITDIPTKSSDNTSYELTVSVTVRNRYGGSTNASKTITVYPYHLPRLKLNTTGDVSYVARCQEDGTADGLGNYGHLHLAWDVSKINTTGSGTINSLQSATVVLNDTTTLSPKSGSISDGYLDYIFPLATETQGNLDITLTDTRKTNTITALSVPKGSMPLSMYDDGSNIGVAFGCMATQAGAWMYMPLYLQSKSGNYMFKIVIDDDGNISTEKV